MMCRLFSILLCFLSGAVAVWAVGQLLVIVGVDSAGLSIGKVLIAAGGLFAFVVVFAGVIIADEYLKRWKDPH